MPHVLVSAFAPAVGRSGAKSTHGSIAHMVQSAVATTVEERHAPFVLDEAPTPGLDDQWCGCQS
jgi:hypothetical protein